VISFLEIEVSMRVPALCIALAGIFQAAAQPVITPRGVSNSASFAPYGVPGGPIARGSTFSIFGTGLGPAATAQQPSYPLQTSIGGVSVKITQGNVAVDALPVFVADTIVSAIMPSSAPLGLVSVRVTYNGQTSHPQTARVVNSNPGLFTSTGFGIGPGSIQNLSGNLAPLNSPMLSATPGQFVTLWANGLGPISVADSGTPPVGNLPFQVEIWVGGVAVTNIAYSGRTPCCAGIDQIVFQIPGNAPAGCYVPVVVRVAGTQVSNTVSMSIDPGGAGCSDSFNPLSLAAVTGGNMAAVVLAHETYTEDWLISPAQTIVTDQAIAYFGNYPGGAYGFNPFIALPPPGSCTTIVTSDGPDFAAGRTPSKDLTAGTLSVAPSSGSPMMMQSITEGVRYDFGLFGLTPALAGTGPIPMFYGPGNYKVTAAGSADVGQFSVTLAYSNGVSWTNRASASTVDRTQPLTLNWTGSGSVYVRGGNIDYPTNSAGEFICNVPSGSSSFTVPPYVLAPLPGTRMNYSNSQGYVEIHTLPSGSPQPIKATGLATGAAWVDVIDRRSALFK
jgi:uncharacterized protein (TIGR03437 family)